VNAPTYPWKKFPNGLEKRDTLAGTHFRLEGGGVEGALPLPPRSRSLRLAREREAGVWGNWMLPSANADAPTSLSNLLLFGLHGIGDSTDEGPQRAAASQFLGVPPGHTSAVFGERH
jgi:hypothetical protein